MNRSPGSGRGRRLDAVHELLADRDVDAMLVTELVHVRYLTGFTGSAAQLLLSGDSVTLLTDGRYEVQSADQLDGAGLTDRVEVVIAGPAGQDDVVAERVSGARLALESESITWARARDLDARLESTELVPIEGLIAELREVKDADEVEAIEAAATIADAALERLRPRLGLLLTEREFALALDHEMLATGAEALSFETICASGPNAALPHARPSERQMQLGDLVVLDFGAVVDGYHSDMTRTFVLGEPSDEAARMLDEVGAAQELGVRAVGPGVTCAAVDRACRDHLTEVGLGQEFVHGTGHGVGLVIHESPWVNGRSDTELRPGHVVTVEPGVYRPGFGGVRVEDTVLVTEQGARRLTHAPKDPVIAVDPAAAR